MPRNYEPVREEYGISKSAISSWCNEFSKECKKQADTDNTVKTDLDIMKENLRLRKELEEMKKENLFLKKAAAFFAKEID